MEESEKLFDGVKWCYDGGEPWPHHGGALQQVGEDDRRPGDCLWKLFAPGARLFSGLWEHSSVWEPPEAE